MNENELKEKTKVFAVAVIKFVETLPNSGSVSIIGKQLLRCGTSVGANYRSACRAKSKADFIAKLSIVEEEADEAMYWLELLVESKLVSKQQIDSLFEMANSLVAIIVASLKTLRGSNNDQSKIQNLKPKIARGVT